MTIRVEEAGSTEEALKVAYAVAHSPLVKTASSPRTPTWAASWPRPTTTWTSRTSACGWTMLVAVNGGRNPSYQEADGQRVMKQAEIAVRIALGRGQRHRPHLRLRTNTCRSTPITVPDPPARRRRPRRRACIETSGASYPSLVTDSAPASGITAGRRQATPMGGARPAAPTSDPGGAYPKTNADAPRPDGRRPVSPSKDHNRDRKRIHHS